MKQLLSSTKQLLSSMKQPMKQLLSTKRNKLLALILALVLVVGLATCSGGNKASEEYPTYVVSIDNLEVHKKASDTSRVLGQLPLDLEIEILEEKTVRDILWGRIDDLKLPDGEKVKAGWIDMQYVRLPGEIEPEETEPVIVVPEEPKTVPATMGTVTAGKLNIRKGPDSKYEADGAYYYGDRIEILETQTTDDTLWGRTNLGWVGMGYVRMDGAPITEEDEIPEGLFTDGNTDVLGYGVVNLGELNVRLGPGAQYTKLGTVKQGVRYAYYQASENWVRIESGWVSTEYFYVEGTATENAFSGKVTAEDLNIRTGPDTSFRNVGTYQQGEVIHILVQVGSWGYTEQGWVFMTYVEPVAPTYTTGTCIVTLGLNIRQEPNAESEIVGTYAEGTVVTILEVADNWGKTDQGWINLQFVKYN